MAFTSNFKIRVKIVEGNPVVSVTGDPILHGELRVILKLIEEGFNKLIKEKRYGTRTE